MPRERGPGWLYPDPETTAQADAREQVLDSSPCPVCGALVPAALVTKHLGWHTAPAAPR